MARVSWGSTGSLQFGILLGAGVPGGGAGAGGVDAAQRAAAHHAPRRQPRVPELCCFPAVPASGTPLCEGQAQLEIGNICHSTNTAETRSQIYIRRGKNLYISLGAKRGASIAAWMRAMPNSSKYQVRNVFRLHLQSVIRNLYHAHRSCCSVRRSCRSVHGSHCYLAEL